VGADVIKVATSGGVLSYGDEPHHAQFGRDGLAVMVAEAAAAGRWVMAHAQSTAGIRNAVEAVSARSSTASTLTTPPSS